MGPEQAGARRQKGRGGEQVTCRLDFWTQSTVPVSFLPRVHAKRLHPQRQSGNKSAGLSLEQESASHRCILLRKLTTSYGLHICAHWEGSMALSSDPTSGVGADQPAMGRAAGGPTMASVLLRDGRRVCPGQGAQDRENSSLFETLPT